MCATLVSISASGASSPGGGADNQSLLTTASSVAGRTVRPFLVRTAYRWHNECPCAPAPTAGAPAPRPRASWPPGLRPPRPWPGRGRASALADTRSSRRVRAARSARADRREDVQYLLAILRELRLPHATHLAQVGQGRRPHRRDLAQRRVV